MTDLLERALPIALLIFMVGSLLEVGLRLVLRDATEALRDGRFVLWSLVWGFVLGPALAVLITRVLPMESPYATGLLFLGLAPCAPFLPLVAEKAGGALAYVAAFVLLSAIGTVALMPLGVPLLVEGFEADAWGIAHPLLLYVLAPLLGGVLLRFLAPGFARSVQPWVKRLAQLATLAVLVLLLVLHGGHMLSTLGTFAALALVLFVVGVALGAYLLSFGLAPAKRSVLALGVGTRNIGAALAPLVAAPGVDPRSLLMVALAVPVTIVGGLVLARVFGRWAARCSPARARPAASPGRP